MKFKVYKTSRGSAQSEERDFNTLEELTDFCAKEGTPLVIHPPGQTHFEGRTISHFEIEIYDDYRE